MTISQCTVIGCLNPKRRNGEKTIHCDMHYARFLRNGTAGSADKKKIYSYDGKQCEIIDCIDLAKKKDLCTKHYDNSKNTKLSAQAVEDMKKSGCEVCGSFKNLRLDHDHSCCPTNSSCENCVRGILCHNCNTAAGLLADDIVRIFSLADYLAKDRGMVHA
jgi:hypothetical protein